MFEFVWSEKRKMCGHIKTRKKQEEFCQLLTRIGKVCDDENQCEAMMFYCVSSPIQTCPTPIFPIWMAHFVLAKWRFLISSGCVQWHFLWENLCFFPFARYAQQTHTHTLTPSSNNHKHARHNLFNRWRWWSAMVRGFVPRCWPTFRRRSILCFTFWRIGNSFLSTAIEQIFRLARLFFRRWKPISNRIKRNQISFSKSKANCITFRIKSTAQQLC